MKEKLINFGKSVYNFIGKHWKVLLICLCVALMLGQCSSCSRDKRTERLKVEVSKQNTTIDSLNNEIKYLNVRLNDAQSHNSNFTNIATHNQQEAYSLIDSLKADNKQKQTTINDLNKQINQLNQTISKLKKENSNLTKRVNSLTEELRKQE